MNYIVCEKPGLLKIMVKPPPVKRPGEALLRIKKVGVCGTDLHAYGGRQAFFSYPRILGHELAAEILQIEPNDQNLREGDEVVVMPYISCQKCFACRSGKTNCCTAIQVLGVHTDGGMQEQISVPVNLLIPAPGLSTRAMAIVEPLAIGAHALRRAQLQKGETIVVVGCGPIGAGIIILAQQLGARVIAVDTSNARLEYARNHFGAAHVVRGGEGALEKIRELTNGDMAAVVCDATGNKAALESGPAFMAHGGRYVLVGLSIGELVFKHPELHARETTLLCSRNATLQDFENVISLLKSGGFPLDSYITHEVDYREMPARFEDWMDPENGVIKAIVNF